MRMPKLRKSYFCARNKRQRTVLWFFWSSVCQFWIPSLPVPVYRNQNTAGRTLWLSWNYIVGDDLRCCCGSVSFDQFLSDIADDARRWNDIHGGYRPSGFSVDKLIAAAVCRKKQQTINLSFVTPLLKGHLCSGDTKFGPVKMFT